MARVYLRNRSFQEARGPVVSSLRMDRVLRTIGTGLGTVTLFYSLFLPGGISRRLGGGLVAAAVGMGIFLGGMALANLPLQAGHLQIATALGMFCVYLTVEIPSRGLASFHEQPLANVRGVTVVGMIVACFLAAWAAGMPEMPERNVPDQSVSQVPTLGAKVIRHSEEAHVRP